jgi:spermidine synthase
VLLAVLIGIALGSLLVAKLAARRRMTPGWLAGVLLAAGASTLMMVFGYNLFPVLVAHLITRFGTTYPLLLTLEVLAVSGFMLLPTLFSGATFPILSRVYVSREGTVSRQIGYLYAMNTVGCILGAFLSGFVLIPLLGLRATVMLCGSLYVLGGTAILLMAGGRPRLVAAVTVPALAVALLLLPTWRTALMSRALFRPSYPDATRLLALAEQGIDIAFYRDGAVATVAVVQGKPPAVYHPENESAEGTRALVVNGKGDASDSVGDMDTQRLVGHLPLLMAPRLDSVLVVGMGSGTTCGAVGLYPVRKIDCVEIEPVVVDASEYFLHVNRNILQDPRFHLIVADARNYLIAGQQKYDVIINEPSNPWVAGVASLFTVENFQALRDHLADDGVICQWLQLYEMSPSDVACVVATFTKVFPDATLWWATREYSDVVLVARKQPWKVDLAQMRQRAQLNPEIAADLARTRFQSPDEVLSYLMLGAADLRRLGATGALNTDDWPYLEFSAPRSLYGDPRQNGVDVLALLTAHRTLPLDEIVAFGPQARDAGTIEALGDSFRRLHTPPIRALFYLGWMRDLFTKAATLAPERHTASEKLKQVEAEASRLRRAAPVDRQR